MSYINIIKRSYPPILIACTVTRCEAIGRLARLHRLPRSHCQSGRTIWTII